jgi:hypothetical protein
MVCKTNILYQINHVTNTGALSTHYLASVVTELFCSRAIWVTHCDVHHFKAGVNFLARLQVIPVSLKINESIIRVLLQIKHTHLCLVNIYL